MRKGKNEFITNCVCVISLRNLIGTINCKSSLLDISKLETVEQKFCPPAFKKESVILSV